MEVKRIPAGVYAANCYIIIDNVSKKGAVIDPGGDSDDILKFINSKDVKIEFILLTHGHFDHLGGALELKEALSAPIYLNEKDERLILNGEFLFGSSDCNGSKVKADKYVSEGDILKLGEVEIKCIETPGHTPGGMSYLLNDRVFTGDTLFFGSIGRTDLSGGDYDTLLNSIHSKLMILPEDLTVYPGHGLQTSIGKEKNNNPFL